MITYDRTGFAGLVKRLTTAGPRMRARAARELREYGGAVLTESQRRVPVATGELRDSGRVDVDTSGPEVRVDITYTAPHALPVHENLDAHHARGGAKFLELPLAESEGAFVAAAGTAVKAALEGE